MNIYKKLKTFLSLKTEVIVLIVSSILSLSSFLYYFFNDLTLEYPDAVGHLNIARSAVDNLTPGFVQLGGIWLPLLHLLMLPTIWNNFMWHSGLSGSVINMVAYVIATFYLFKLIYLVTNNKLSSLIGTSVFALNINLLYMQSTPMSEALFISTLILSIYFLLLWSRTFSLNHLIISSFMFFLTSINRYEGWSVALSAVLVTAFIAFQKKNFKYAESTAIIFGSAALFGIILWIGWQNVIFHNPFYFLNSAYSSKGQTLQAIQLGQVPTYKNLRISVVTGFYALMHVNGLIALLLGLLGFTSFSLSNLINKEKREIFYTLLPLYLLFIPFVFLIFALFNGNIPINVPEFKQNGSSLYFNIRYALYTLPAIAVFSALITNKKKVYIALIICVLLNTFLLFPTKNSQIATLEDAQKNHIALKPINEWIKNNYDGGYILISEATSSPLMFASNLNISSFITEGNKQYWDESMKDPSKYAKYAIITDNPRDMINVNIDHESFSKNFQLVKNFSGYNMYKARN